MEKDKERVQSIIERMKAAIGVAKDVELGEYFGGARSAPAVWKTRAAIPFLECLELAEKSGHSLDWLIRGVESKAHNEDAENIDIPLYSLADYAQGQDAKSMLSIPKKWLNEEQLCSEKTLLLHVVGDTMSPTIQHGQHVIIDRRKKTIDGVYLVSYGGLTRLKRLQYLADGSVRLRCDNQAYTDEILPPSAKIKIIGYCHSVICRVL